MQGKMLGGFNSIRMVRKGPFYEQFAPTLPVSAESAYQTTGIGVVSLGRFKGQAGFTCGQDDALSW